MPHTASAAKRLRKSETRRVRNKLAAKKLKLRRKSMDAAIKTNEKANIEAEFKQTQATLDRSADKGYIHPNKAARLKSRLAKRIKAAAASKK